MLTSPAWVLHPQGEDHLTAADLCAAATRGARDLTLLHNYTFAFHAHPQRFHPAGAKGLVGISTMNNIYLQGELPHLKFAPRSHVAICYVVNRGSQARYPGH